MVELITLEKFTNAYGLLLLVQGIANLVGPPIGGWLYDVTGKYDLSFYLAGIFIALSGGLLLVLPAVGKYKKFCEFRRRLSEAQNNNSYKMNNLTVSCGTKLTYLNWQWDLKLIKGPDFDIGTTWSDFRFPTLFLGRPATLLNV